MDGSIHYKNEILINLSHFIWSSRSPLPLSYLLVAKYGQAGTLGGPGVKLFIYPN